MSGQLNAFDMAQKQFDSVAEMLKLDAGVREVLRWPSFVPSALAPMTPVMIWALRERDRHAATCELLDRLNEDVKKLIDKSVAGATEQEISMRSRELQDAIYNHRVSSPLIFDIYNRLRGRMEERMNAGARELVDRLRLAPAPMDMTAKVGQK